MDGDGMDGDIGSISVGDDVAIPIIPLMAPAYEGSRVSDSGLHGGADSAAYSFPKSRDSNGTNLIRRRNSEPNATGKNQTMIRAAYYPARSRVKESHSKPLLETNSRDPDASNPLHEKIKAMKSGTVLPETQRDVDVYEDESEDEKGDADEDDDDTEETEKNESGDVEKCGYNQGDHKKPRRYKKRKVLDVLMKFSMLVCSFVLLMVSIRNQMLLGSEIWRWCVLVLVIVFGRWITKLVNNCVVLFIETKFFFDEKAVYYLHGLKKSVRSAVWVASVLAAWVLLIQKRSGKTSTSKAIEFVTRTLVSVLIGAVLWMVKTVLVKLVAAKFHVKSFFAKIKEAVSDEYVLDLLTLSVMRSNMNVEDGGPASAADEGSGWRSWFKWMRGRERKGVQQKIQHENSFTLKKLGRMKPGKMPASTMAHLIHKVRSSKLSFVSDPKLGEQKHITTGSEAERAASQIFKNVATNKDHPGYITMEDLLPFENSQNKDCLYEWFLKLAEDGKISELVLSEWVVNMYKQRDYLAHSLKDSKTAIEELDRIFCGFLCLLIFVVWLLVTGLATTKILLLFSSQILLLGFMFGNTCKTLFDCLIFVFVMHPFDVGDRCVVEGVQMIVEEMDILKTAFLRYDNEMIYYPNDVLKTKAIGNFNRSPEKMGDSVVFHVDCSTSMATISDLSDKIKMYVEKEKPQHWHPNPSLQVKEINDDICRMKLAVYVDHRMNFQDFGEKSRRRSELVGALKQMLEDLGIKYHPQQVYNYHIGSTPFQPPASTAGRRSRAFF